MTAFCRYFTWLICGASFVACGVTYVPQHLPISCWHVWPLLMILPVFAGVIWCVTRPAAMRFSLLPSRQYGMTWRGIAKRKTHRWRSLTNLVPMPIAICWILAIGYGVASALTMIAWYRGGTLVEIDGAYALVNREQQIALLSEIEMLQCQASSARLIGSLALLFSIFCIAFFDFIVPRAAKFHFRQPPTSRTMAQLRSHTFLTNH